MICEKCQQEIKEDEYDAEVLRLELESQMDALNRTLDK